MSTFFKTPAAKVSAFLASPAGAKFQKLAGMLGSDGTGERSNAAEMASRLLREAGLSWGEVLGGGAAPANGRQRPSDGGQATRIRDLETRLTIANGQLRVAHVTIARANAGESAAVMRADKLQTELGKLKIELTTAKREVEAARRAFEKAGIPGLKPEPAPIQPKRVGEFDTLLQRQLNDLIDEIEDAVELNDWEQGFLKSIRDIKWKITPKQWEKVCKLAENAGLDPDKFVDAI